MNKKILITGAFLGIISIILGAFAAHGLKALIPETAIHSFETGVRYQMYHALFLLFLGSNIAVPQKPKKIIFTLILVGVILFSGSIYGLATNSLTSSNFKPIALLKPLGGLLLIFACLIFLINFLNIKEDN